MTINTEHKKLYDEKGENELADLSSSFTPQKLEFIKAGGSYAIVFGKKLQAFACDVLSIDLESAYAPSQIISNEGQGLTAVEKIFNRNAVGVSSDSVLHSGSDVRVKVNIVGSQDTTGLMTTQELEAMAATVISPTLDGAYQSGCHTASVWDSKAQANIPRLMNFMNTFGLITARDPKGVYHAMTDVIHKVLNDITVDDWAIIIGGDSHTRMSKGVAFGADSGTVALALATGEVTMPIPESVKVTFKGSMKNYMDFRDVVHATQQQMLAQCNENVFQGRIIEVHLGTLLADQAFTFTDWTAEMKAKASICISQDETLIESLEIAKSRIQIMVDKGMDNDEKTLSGLIEIANNRIKQIKSGEKPALAPDENAKYFSEVVIDLDEIDEPMIADPDVDNDDVSKRYTHDTIRPISYYAADKKVDLGFVGSCMVHKGDMKILARMLKNIEANEGTVDFKAPLVVAPPTYNIVEELKAEGDWDVLQKYAGFEFNDDSPKSSARVEYENILYLERPGCNLCMGNQEKAGKGDTVMATSTRLFQGRVVGDAENKKGESLLASTPVVVLSTILGRTPSIEEYKTELEGKEKADNKLKQLLKLETKIEQNIDTSNKSIKFFAENDTCPVCTQSIDRTFREQKGEQLHKKCAELETGIKKLTSEIDKVEEQINYFGNISKKLSDLYVDIAKVNTSLEELNNYSDRIHEEILQLENKQTDSKKIATDLQQLKEELEICLLYTSPSPRDLSTSRMPSSA